MKKIVFKIEGMHCVSCALNIDAELEDTEGVTQSNTNYAKSQTDISFDENKIKTEKIKEIIKKLGYKVL